MLNLRVALILVAELILLSGQASAGVFKHQRRVYIGLQKHFIDRLIFLSEPDDREHKIKNLDGTIMAFLAAAPRQILVMNDPLEFPAFALDTHKLASSGQNAFTQPILKRSITQTYAGWFSDEVIFYQEDKPENLTTALILPFKKNVYPVSVNYFQPLNFHSDQMDVILMRSGLCHCHGSGTNCRNFPILTFPCGTPIISTRFKRIDCSNCNISHEKPDMNSKFDIRLPVELIRFLSEVGRILNKNNMNSFAFIEGSQPRRFPKFEEKIIQVHQNTLDIVSQLPGNSNLEFELIFSLKDSILSEIEQYKAEYYTLKAGNFSPLLLQNFRTRIVTEINRLQTDYPKNYDYNGILIYPKALSEIGKTPYLYGERPDDL